MSKQSVENMKNQEQKNEELIGRYGLGEIAAELEKEKRDETLFRFAEKRAMTPASKTTRSDDIFSKYAIVILERVLSEPEIKPLTFAFGNDEQSKEIRKKVMFAVTNMAKELTDEHMKLNP